MEQIRNNKKTKKYYIILFIIISLQLFRIIYSFAFLKEDCHSDEQWSYGLSNSYYEPYIFEDADETMLTNNNTWTSSEVYKNYLTVQSDHRFSYDSVFYNQSKDLHPPLYYLILHTICSFFPEKFSFWYGFSINIIFFIVTQIFLFLIIREITDSEITALSGCFLYGASTGALNTFVFIRMYAMATGIASASCYFHIRMQKSNNMKRYLPMAFITTLAGVLTHHFFLLFAGVFSACFCFYYLFRKKIKQLLIYALTMLSTVGVSILIFPATINHLFFRRGTITKFEPSWQLRIAFNVTLSELFSIRISLFKTPYVSIFFVVLGVLIVFLLPVAFLLRNEPWFRKILNSSVSFIKNAPGRLIRLIKSFSFPVWTMIISGLSVIIGTAYSVSAITMSNQIDRYIFMVFPIITGAVIYTVHFLLKYIILRSSSAQKNINKTIALLSAITVISVNVSVKPSYLWPKPDDTISSAELLNESNCIFISNEYWIITCMADKFMNCEYIYTSTYEDMKNEIDNLCCPDSDEPVYLMANADIFSSAESEYTQTSESTYAVENGMPKLSVKKDEQILKEDFEQMIRSHPITSSYKYLGYDTVFERLFYIYRIS